MKQIFAFHGSTCVISEQCESVFWFSKFNNAVGFYSDTKHAFLVNNMHVFGSLIMLILVVMVIIGTTAIRILDLKLKYYGM